MCDIRHIIRKVAKDMDGMVGGGVLFRVCGWEMA